MSGQKISLAGTKNRVEVLDRAILIEKAETTPDITRLYALQDRRAEVRAKLSTELSKYV